MNLEEFCKAVDFIKDCGMGRVTLEGGYLKHCSISGFQPVNGTPLRN
ncbi:MAG: hypothetical protein QW421_03780 [Archaeoglobaceae archaeon]